MAPTRKRKRSASELEDSDAEDDTEKKKKLASRKELHEFADNREIPKKKRKIRLRTVTSSMDACLRDDLPRRDTLLKTMDSDSRALGTLRHLVSVYLNVLVDDAPCDAVYELIFERWFIYQLFGRLGMREMRSDSDKRFNSPLYQAVKTHLETYMVNHTLSDTIRSGFQEYPSRLVNSVTSLMLSAIKRHVHENFPSRAQDHLRCLLDQILGGILHEKDVLKEDLKKAAKVLYVCCGTLSDASARAKINTFCAGANLPHWKQPLMSILLNYRNLFAPLREPPPPDSKRPRLLRRVSSDGCDNFRYQLKSNYATMLKIIRQFRISDAEIIREKQLLWDAINEEQPKMNRSPTKDGYREQLRSPHIAVPGWLDSDEPLNSVNEYRLISAVSEFRKSLWQQNALPGFDSVPKRFSLLPKYSLTRAFVQYDQQSIRFLLHRVGMKSLPKNARLWWTPVFDFHSSETVKRKNQQELKRSGKSRAKRRKVLKQRRKLRKGIPMLGSSKSRWVVIEEEYKKEKRKKQGPIPWLVNSITTDGLQIKVTMATLESTSEWTMAPGVDCLEKRGYGQINSLYDVRKHSRGVFSDARAVPRNFSGRLFAIGVDPGLVQVSTSVRTRLQFPRREEEFNPSSFSRFQSSFSSKMYRFQNLSTATQNFEKRRRVGEYNDAVQRFSSVSLAIPDKAREYAIVVYDTLDVMSRELLCNLRRKQRFSRFRAQQRAINHLASSVAYDEEQEPLRRTKGRDKRSLKKELYARKRVVFFGSAQFGHGARGPVPRKALIRALALKCPVVLVDEYRTSKCCHGCGTVLQQGPGFRVFRCTNSQTGEDSCSVYHIDRDINAARNIGTCGVHMLLGKPRPQFLQRGEAT